MFENPGEMIKRMAHVLFGVALAGIVIMIFNIPEGADKKYLFMYFIAAVIGGYMMCLLIYGFGEIIDKLTEIAHNTKPADDMKNSKEVDSNEKKNEQ